MSPSPAPGRPTVWLIDGYANIFRAFYAIRNLTDARGAPTNAVFGFLQMLRKLLRDHNPSHLGVALDTSGPTVRSAQYADYKANRKPMPDELRAQIPHIRSLLEAYRIPMLELPTYEADDVLGTLAAKGRDAGYDVVLVSPDKDLMQLVDAHVHQLHPTRDKRYDPAGVEEDFGVPPGQVIDVLALMGDASDNVPGVPGIGEKGAKTLIRQHGSLDALLDAAPEVKRKSYREGLIEHREQAILSRDLVTIHTDLDVDFDADALRYEGPDPEMLRTLCVELDFHSVVKEIDAEHGAAAQLSTKPAPAVEPVDADALGAALDRLGRRVCVGMVARVPSTVTASVATAPLGLAFADADATDGDTLFVDLRAGDATANRVADRLAGWLGDGDVTLVGHDLKEVLRWAHRQRPQAPTGTDVRCGLFDTMLAGYLLKPSLRGTGLGDVAFERMQYTAFEAADAGFAKDADPLRGSEMLARYAAERVALPRRMLTRFEADLDQHGLRAVYDRYEAPLVPVLTAMEELGVGLDAPYLADMSTELGAEADALEAEIYRLAGETFNLNSSKQLGEILFDKLGYPVIKRTRKTRNYATDAETLEALAARGFEIPERLLRYRELTKLRSTYVDALPALVDPADQRLHTRFNQAITATGRLSSSHPNLQNIPVRTELGLRVRKAFRAAPGHRLVVADYSQIELRVLAHIAGEGAMLDAFRAGDDIHAATAAAVFGVDPALVSGEQRRMAKTINFGIIYGMSAFGLAARLGIERKDAQGFIDRYMARYPGVANYTEETLASAEETGQVATLSGRIRWLPEINSRNRGVRENAKRMAINARIQGTAADLLKDAMIRVDRRLRASQPDARLLLTVHDELVLEVPEDAVAPTVDLVRAAMIEAAALDVPVVVDAGSGATWYDAKD
ncbi:MAG: DNA polymerase I [Acidobacteriota bacterium]